MVLTGMLVGFDFAQPTLRRSTHPTVYQRFRRFPNAYFSTIRAKSVTTDN